MNEPTKTALHCSSCDGAEELEWLCPDCHQDLINLVESLRNDSDRYKAGRDELQKRIAAFAEVAHRVKARGGQARRGRIALYDKYSTNGGKTSDGNPIERKEIARGWFHRWAQEGDEDGTGPVAIVELDDGGFEHWVPDKCAFVKVDSDQDKTQGVILIRKALTEFGHDVDYYSDSEIERGISAWLGGK
jgi:hypothetical protein